MPGTNFEFYYMFSVSLDFESKRIGESPAGMLVDVALKGTGEVTTDKTLRNVALRSPLKENEPETRTPGWNGIEGKIINWNDWVIQRPDDVAEFNGRATIRTHDSCLIGVAFNGCVDTYDRKPKIELPIQLAVRFEGGQQPPEWADPRYQTQKPQWQYRRLFRDQFIARGLVSLNGDRLPESAKLKIWGPGERAFALEKGDCFSAEDRR